MKNTQKIIKYFAYSLAASIIVSIIFGFFGLLKGISFVVDNNSNEKKMETTSYENIDISSLEIELVNTNLTIKTGDYFKITTNNEDLTFKQTDNTLYIKEKEFYSFWNINKEDLIIHIPEEILFNNVIISTGASKVNINKLNVNDFSYEIGAGDLKITDLNVIDKAYIKCGAGKVSLMDSSINNLNFDQGVGKTDISGKITGISNIKSGVGKLSLVLTDGKENYKILTSKGIGEINIDGIDYNDNSTFGEGNSYINLEGGIGVVNISFN